MHSETNSGAHFLTHMARKVRRAPGITGARGLGSKSRKGAMRVPMQSRYMSVDMQLLSTDGILAEFAIANKHNGCWIMIIVLAYRQACSR
jgi:hypothetical protein